MFSKSPEPMLLTSKKSESLASIPHKSVTQKLQREVYKKSFYECCYGSGRMIGSGTNSQPGIFALCLISNLVIAQALSLQDQHQALPTGEEVSIKVPVMQKYQLA